MSRDVSETGPVDTPVGNRDDWSEVVRRLDDWPVEAVALGDERIAVTLPNGRMVEVVMNADDLADLSENWGDLEEVVTEVRDRLLSLPTGCRYLVMEQYDLVAQATPDRLSVVDSVRELQGEWTVQDQDGRVVSRLADWREHRA